MNALAVAPAAAAEAAAPIRILFVLARTTGGGIMTDLRLLAGRLDAVRYRIDMVVCACRPNAREEACEPLEALGIAVDRIPCCLSFEDTVVYLAGKIPAYDIVVSCQDVADIYPALERLHLRPPLIEHGSMVAEALAGPKHFTARYVGVSGAIRAAAAGRLRGREHHAVEIPPLADATPFRSRAGDPADAAVAMWRRLFDEVIAERPRPPRPAPLFRSFFQGGFESSSHRRCADRTRIDMIAATQHDLHAAADYAMLGEHGILTIRDGVRWHLIERTPGRYDWSSLDAQLAAAEATGAEVIWDLLHYGWPDGLDIWGTEFVPRFAAFAAAAARAIGARTAGRTGGHRFYAPVNEISFFAWAGGDVAYFNPFARGRGVELKAQLARAAIAAMEAILAIDRHARFVHADPVMHVACDPSRPWEAAIAEGHRQSQFEAWDMIAGMRWQQLGGRRELLDVIGVNYYFNNQRVHGGATLDIGDPLYKPFRAILAETHARYGRPIFVAETGIEDDRRPAWLRYVVAETRAAIALGVPVEGICLYPILDHPGWDDGRYCHNGLLRHSTDAAERTAFAPLAAVLAEEQALHRAG